MNNHGKTSPKELAFIFAQIIPTILMWVFGFYPMAIAFTIWTILFLLQEWFWDTKTGKTISQHFWFTGKGKKIQAVLICASILIQFIFLVVHLLVPVFR